MQEKERGTEEWLAWVCLAAAGLYVHALDVAEVEVLRMDCTSLGSLQT